MSKEMTELYQQLLDNYVGLGYPEEGFYDNFPIKAVVLLDHLYNYPDKTEIMDAIEYGYLETLVPGDILTEVADLEERFKLYIKIREFGNEVVETPVVVEEEEDLVFDLDDEDEFVFDDELSEVGEVVETPVLADIPQPQPNQVVEEQYETVIVAPIAKQTEQPIIITEDAVDVVIPMPNKSSADPRELLGGVPQNVKAKLLYIKEKLPQVVEKAVALCAECKVMSGKNGAYLTLRFKDIEGKFIGAKLWGYKGSEEDAKNFVGSVCSLTGKWDNYNGTDQFVLTNLDVITGDSLAKCGISNDTFSIKPDKPLVEYSRTLLSLIQNMEDTEYKNLLDTIFVKHGFIEKYAEVPAGITFHHAGKGQLLQHAIEVATTAISMSTIYSYMTFNMNLIVAGCLLHDIGKVLEMPKNGSMDYTHTGCAVGHMGLGASLITRYAIEIGMSEQKLYDLLSIVMTHHGEIEKGSPVKANSPDAMLVHMADETSAMLNHMWINSCDMKPHEDTLFSKGRNYIRLS